MFLLGRPLRQLVSCVSVLEVQFIIGYSSQSAFKNQGSSIIVDTQTTTVINAVIETWHHTWPIFIKTSTTTDDIQLDTMPRKKADNNDKPGTTARNDENSGTTTNAFVEPKIKWKRSEAKALLTQDIRDGRVPPNAKDKNGKSTMQLRDIYNMRPQYKEYDYAKFSSRLSALRSQINQRDARAMLDQEAFDNYVQKHPVSFFSHKGCIQWQGSEAQRLAREDMEKGVHKTMSRLDWYGSKPECYESFPLDAFRDKVKQEIRTAKHLHTIEIKGKDPRKHDKQQNNNGN